MKNLTKKLISALMALVMTAGGSVYAEDAADVTEQTALSQEEILEDASIAVASACPHNHLDKTDKTLISTAIVGKHTVKVDNNGVTEIQTCQIMEYTYRYAYKCSNCGAIQYYTTNVEEKHTNPNCH